MNIYTPVNVVVRLLGDGNKVDEDGKIVTFFAECNEIADCDVGNDDNSGRLLSSPSFSCPMDSSRKRFLLPVELFFAECQRSVKCELIDFEVLDVVGLNCSKFSFDVKSAFSGEFCAS